MKRTSSFFSSKRSGLILGAALGVSTLLAGVSFAQGSIPQGGGGLTIPNSIDNTAITIKKIFLSPTGIMQENAPIELNGIDGIVKVGSNSAGSISPGRIMTTNLQVDNTVKFSALGCPQGGLEETASGTKCILTVDAQGNVNLTGFTDILENEGDEANLWKMSGESDKDIYFGKTTLPSDNGNGEALKVRIGIKEDSIQPAGTQLIVRKKIESREGFRIVTSDNANDNIGTITNNAINATESSIMNDAANNALIISNQTRLAGFGGGSYASKIIFRAPNTQTKVGINTTTPLGELDVVGNSIFQGTAKVVNYLTVGHPTSFVPTTTDKLFVNGSTRANAYYYNSDAKYKTNVALIDNALEKISALHGYSYYNKLSEKNDIGIIAQEVEKVFPELVQTDTEGYKSVSYGNLIAPVIQAVQELAGKLEALTVSMNDLFDKYADQQSQIDALEKRLQSLEQAK